MGWFAYLFAALLAAAVGNELHMRRGLGLLGAVGVGAGAGVAAYMACVTLFHWALPPAFQL